MTDASAGDLATIVELLQKLSAKQEKLAVQVGHCQIATNKKVEALTSQKAAETAPRGVDTIPCGPPGSYEDTSRGGVRAYRSASAASLYSPTPGFTELAQPSNPSPPASVFSMSPPPTTWHTPSQHNGNGTQASLLSFTRTDSNGSSHAGSSSALTSIKHDSKLSKDTDSDVPEKKKGLYPSRVVLTSESSLASC